MLNCNAGDDRLTGGAGDDVLADGTGRDVLDGGERNDTFVFNEGAGFDRNRNFDLLGDAVSATFGFGNGDRLNIVLDSVDNLTA